MRRKRLATLLPGHDVTGNPWVTGIETDSRRVTEGDVFVCIRGYTVDGHLFAEDAVERGAVAVLSEIPLPHLTVPNILLGSTKQEIGRLASIFYDHPSRRMRVYGVTGTNGKTTTTKMTYDLFRLAGRVSGMVSTTGAVYASRELDTPNTTPEAVVLQRILADMVEAGVTDCVLEVSSHALIEGRVEGISFYAAAFTNLTHDHLDYHATMEEYADAKALLFRQVELTSGEAIVLNEDDEASEVMRREAPRTRVVWYGTSESSKADLVVTWGEDSVTVRKDSKTGQAKVHFLGAFNAANIAAASALASTGELTFEQLLENIPKLTLPTGRLERVDFEQCEIYIDYAHTPDGLDKCLKALDSDDMELVVVLSAAGDRDRTKRAEMGRIAGAYCKEVIVTVHDARSEDPNRVIDDLIQGIPEGVKTSSYPERTDALHHAAQYALAGRRVVVIGKGHERVQRIGQETIPFNEAEIILNELHRLRGQEPAV